VTRQGHGRKVAHVTVRLTGVLTPQTNDNNFPVIHKNTHSKGHLVSRVDPACRPDRLSKFENSKMAWNYRELIICITELMLGQVTPN